MAFLEIKGLELAMRNLDGESLVLKGVNINVEKGQILGLVGETGSGKSLTGLSVSRLVPTPPGRYIAGSIMLDGFDTLRASEAEMRKLRGRKIGMIFQDPTTNLNPSFRIATQMIDVALAAEERDEGFLGLARSAGRKARRLAARALAVELLGRVGVTDADQRIEAYPHQFSGGMRQRVLIAMALIGRPDLLIADEPTTALDVSVQAQVLRLIHGFVKDRKLTVVFITHNLGVVAQLCNTASVMRHGQVVEQADVRTLLKSPQHPYTRALLSSVPTLHTKRGSLYLPNGNAF